MKQSSSFRPAAGAEGAAITEGPIDMPALLAAARHPDAGAVVLFSGDVRDSNRGKAVAFLEYEAHVPLAEAMIRDIVAEAQAKWNLTAAVAQHRIGRAGVGEPAVVVITSSVHRREAYEANRYIIEKIKHEAPIWKCEHFTDGSSEWGNNCNCHEVTGDVSKHIYESKG